MTCEHLHCVVRGGDVVHFIGNLGIIGSVKVISHRHLTLQSLNFVTLFQQPKASGVSGS